MLLDVVGHPKPDSVAESQLSSLNLFRLRVAIDVHRTWWQYIGIRKGGSSLPLSFTRPDFILVYSSMSTHPLGIQHFLYQWYAVSGRLSAASPGSREDVPVFQSKGYGLCLHKGRAREAHVSEGSEYPCIEKMVE